MTEVEQHSTGRTAPPPPPRLAGDAQGSSVVRLVSLALCVVLLGLVAGLSAVVVVLAIVVMIALHELGHFVTARAAGMKCTEFFIGFGPRLWSIQRGETEYGIKAIPAGAYVKVIGMTNLEEVDPADEDRTYRQKPYWRRMSVAVAGSVMHFAIALVCLYALLVGWGISSPDNWEVGRLAAIEADGDDLGPAAAAGIEVGDEVVAVGEQSVSTFDDLRAALADLGPGDEVLVTVERSGEEITRPVVIGDNGEGGAFLGVAATYPREPVGALAAVPRTFAEFGSFSWQSGGALVDFFSPSGLSGFIGDAVDTRTDPDAAAAADPAESSRVLSIYGAARIGTQAADDGVSSLLGFLVLINIFIGIFNLVPLLPLDGGHVAVATYERVRELASRSGQRYHADVAKLMPLTYLVVFVLVSVGLVALYMDVVNPVDLN